MPNATLSMRTDGPDALCEAAAKPAPGAFELRSATLGLVRHGRKLTSTFNDSDKRGLGVASLVVTGDDE